jgi:hypothetical protein
MKRLLAAATVIAALAAVPAQASNILVNGSFENGLTGWTTGGTQLSYPPAVIITDGVTGSAFGEAVPADTIVGGSPDAAGTHGVYFVDDIANQFLRQSVFLTAGTYEVGFDAYVPQNGFNNRFDATFSGSIVNIQLANFSVHNQNLPRVWQHFSGLALVGAAGSYDVTFNYQSFGSPAADVVIDRVYVTASDSGDGTPIPSPVPEPGTLMLLGSGVAGLVARARNRK